jgi:hypothetical protein
MPLARSTHSGALGIDLLPGRWLPALRRWTMGVRADRQKRYPKTPLWHSGSGPFRGPVRRASGRPMVQAARVPARTNKVSRMWSTARACCSRQKILASYSISWSLAWVTVPGGTLSMPGTQRDQTTTWRTHRPLSCYARYRRAAVEPKPTFAPEHSHGVPTCARLMSRYEGNGQPHHRSLRAPCPRLGYRP